MAKKYLGLFASAVAFALVLPSVAAAEIIVDFGPSCAKETNRSQGDPISVAGDVLTIVGKVVQFNEPFEDLDANDPAKEYTYIMTGMVSTGTNVSGGGSFIFYTTNYTGGTLRVYCDPAMDADPTFVDETTYTNGECILEADLSNFKTDTNSFQCAGNQFADFTFTGGTLFNRVSDNGNGFSGENTGLFDVCAQDAPGAACTALSNTKLDMVLPTPTETRSWGQVKSLYQ